MTSPALGNIDSELVSTLFLDDPYPIYARLRAEDPVHWSDPWQTWVISRYDDIQSILRADGKTTTITGRMHAALQAYGPQERAHLGLVADHYSRGLLHSDPPDHTRLRALVNKVFNPRVVEGLRPVIAQVADELIDEADARADVDLIRDFAFGLPASVVAIVLGVPPEERFEVRTWIAGLNDFLGSNRPSFEVASTGQDNLRHLRDYLAAVAEERRVNPREDVISRLVHARDHDGTISQEELLSTCVTFLVGGHVTTTALISTGVMLLRQTGAWDRLVDGEVAIESAVEEILRFESPNQRIIRIAKVDQEIGGQPIRAGDPLMLLLGSADRDGDRFPAPDQFDISRGTSRHLAFAGGEHFCVGASLARAEGSIAIQRLIDRHPDLRLLESELVWTRSPTLRLLEQLPVAWG